MYLCRTGCCPMNFGNATAPGDYSSVSEQKIGGGVFRFQSPDVTAAPKVFPLRRRIFIEV